MSAATARGPRTGARCRRLRRGREHTAHQPAPSPGAPAGGACARSPAARSRHAAPSALSRGREARLRAPWRAGQPRSTSAERAADRDLSIAVLGDVARGRPSCRPGSHDPPLRHRKRSVLRSRRRRLADGGCHRHAIGKKVGEKSSAGRWGMVRCRLQMVSVETIKANTWRTIAASSTRGESMSASRRRHKPAFENHGHRRLRVRQYAAPAGRLKLATTSGSWLRAGCAAHPPDHTYRQGGTF